MGFWNKANEASDLIEESVNEIPQPSPVSPFRNSPVEEDLLRRFGRIRSAFSPGTIIQGKMSFDSPVRIDGKISGELFSAQTLLVGANATVNAGVEAETVVILGKVKGTIKARARVEIFPGADVDAHIASPVLVVHEGASVQGRCRVSPA